MRVKRDVVPRIHEDYLGCVVFLYPTLDDAISKAKVGGTGFLLRVTHRLDKGDVSFIYIVTCAHVIGDAKVVVTLNSRMGKSVNLETWSDHWVKHPMGHDVATCLMPESSNPMSYRYISENQVVGLMEANLGMVGLGDEVFMVGRFATHQGADRNIPVVRFGNISMMPHETIYQDTRKHHQKSYLVESRSLAGLSGSPVFTYEPYVRTDDHAFGSCGRQHHRDASARGEGSQCIAMTAPLLLGMNWGNVKINDKAVVIPTYQNLELSVNSGFAAVVPAWQIMELIQSDEVSSKRKQLAEEILSRESVAELDVL